MKAWEVQQAVYSRLVGFAGLIALIGTRVYDRAPHQITTDSFPYVVVGDDTSVEDDTFSRVGWDHTVTLHVWSRYPGRKETKQIQQAIYDALHQHALVVAGATTIDCVFEFANSFLDPDGLTRHGVSRFRVTATAA